MLVPLAASLPLWLLGALPPRLAPWVPLKIDDPPGRARAWKQQRAAARPALCRAVLEGAGVTYTPLPDRATGPGCGFRDAVRLEGVGALRFEAVSLSCPAALALTLWEHDVVQPAARRLLGSTVTRLEHFGSYACRNVAGRAERRSAHARAEALDVAGFRTADGRRLRVVRDHPLTAPPVADGGDPAAAFLATVERGACRQFRVVLGPAYNAAHRDHFHLEWSGAPWRYCR